MSPPVDPETPAEWQDAANAASFFLLLESARAFGLVTGGPTVDVDRCDQILEAAAARGVTPADGDELCARFLPGMAAAAE